MSVIRRIVCVLKGHDYTSWKRALDADIPVPMAACERCGVVA